jgi:molybdopterin-guanine dinucleotide biosynthesis protein A
MFLSNKEYKMLTRDLNIFTHAAPVAGKSTAAAGMIPGVTGVILAGGASSRMGSNKALLPYRGGRFIEAIYRLLDGLFDEVIVVTNTPEQYRFLPCRMVGDVFPGMGALAGIHAGLRESANPWIFAVACDMPYLNGDLIRRLFAARAGEDAVVPDSGGGPEPLHAFYGKLCLPFIEEALRGDKRRIVSFYPRVRVRTVPAGEIARIDPGFDSFLNVNTPAEYYRLRGAERGEESIRPASAFGIDKAELSAVR